MIDTDDAVFERLAIRELNRPFRPRIHRGLRLGVGGRSLTLRRNILGHGLLLVEYPVLRVLGHRRLHGRGCRAGIAATRCATAFGTTAGPAVHRVADKVELVADGTGDLRSREYHHQTDDSRDQYVLDD